MKAKLGKLQICLYLKLSKEKKNFPLNRTLNFLKNDGVLPHDANINTLTVSEYKTTLQAGTDGNNQKLANAQMAECSHMNYIVKRQAGIKFEQSKDRNS